MTLLALIATAFEGARGRVPMRMELALRPDYGSIRPRVELASDGVISTAGPDAFRLRIGGERRLTEFEFPELPG